MTQLNGRILYRWTFTAYLIIPIMCCFFPAGPMITMTPKNDGVSLLLRIIAAFVPYLAISGLLVLLTSILKLQHISVKNRKIARIGSFLCLIIIVLSVAIILLVTFARWQGIYPDMGNTTDMDGGIEWISAWAAGICAGWLVLLLGYLHLSKPSSTSDSSTS